jgi:secretion/DNA translocation related CpaE-like protein
VHSDTERPLAILSTEPILDQAVQLAAVAGCVIDRVPDAVAARRRWSEAPLVLLDADAVAACADAGLPRRAGVVVLCVGEPPPALWQRALAIGAERVLSLPAGESWLLSTFADATDRPAAVTGRVVSLLGGRGGAGASILAVAVALTALRSGTGALLIDGDPLGGGLDLLLGAEAQTGLRWPDLHLQGGRVPAHALRSALPGRTSGNARLSVISCDRDGPGPDPEAMAAVIEAGRRAGDTVVVDLPRHPTPAAEAALDRTDLAVLVVPAELRAAAAARRVADTIRARGVPLRCVVRGPAPSGLNATDLAQATETELLTAIRADPALPHSIERTGLTPKPRSPLTKAANAILTALTPTTTPP